MTGGYSRSSSAYLGVYSGLGHVGRIGVVRSRWE